MLVFSTFSLNTSSKTRDGLLRRKESKKMTTRRRPIIHSASLRLYSLPVALITYFHIFIANAIDQDQCFWILLVVELCNIELPQFTYEVLAM